MQETTDLKNLFPQSMRKMETKVYLMSLVPFREQYPADSKREIEKTAGDYLVKTVFSRLLDCSPEGVTILRDGKPQVKNGNLHFNLSHSGEFLALAVGEAPLGVDIEKIGAIRENVVASYFTEEEKNLVKERGAVAFYKIWTKKESYVKYTGEGIKGLRKLSSFPEAVGFYTETISDYQLSVCAEPEFLPKQIELWNEPINF